MKCCYECENLRDQSWTRTDRVFVWRCSISHYVDDIWEEIKCPDFVQGYEDKEHELNET